MLKRDADDRKGSGKGERRALELMEADKATGG
jgi:hypothetical protein